MPLSEEKIAELKSKHGDDLRLVEAADGTARVFRKPSRHAYDRWFDKRESKPSEAAREIAQDCLAFPDYGTLLSTLDKQPALLMGGGGVIDAVTQLAGVGMAPEVKKL